MCEVEVSQIHQWLREERLELAEGSGIVLNCEICGSPIMSGRYCDKCRRDLTMGLKDVVRANKKEEPEIRKAIRDGDKMRFLNQ